MNGDELEPGARELVELARDARTPSDEQRDRAYQALMAGLAGGAAFGAAKAARASAVTAKSSLIWLKFGMPALALLSLAVGGFVWRSRHSAVEPRPSLAVPTQSAAPSAALPVSAAPSSSVSAPDDAASAAPDSSLAPAFKPAPALAKPSADDLVQELSLLHQALAESRSGHAARALELARQHAQRYPNSHLRVERDAIEVRSLCALGRAPEARKIADRLRTQAPNSPVSAALAETCVGK